MGFFDRDIILDPRQEQAVGTFSSRVYGWMAMGLAFTAAIAYFVFRTGLYMQLMPLWWILALATFGVVSILIYSLISIGLLP